MARIIDFHIPDNYRPQPKWTPPQDRGKILEFSKGMKRSA